MFTTEIVKPVIAASHAWEQQNRAVVAVENTPVARLTHVMTSLMQMYTTPESNSQAKDPEQSYQLILSNLLAASGAHAGSSEISLNDAAALRRECGTALGQVMDEVLEPNLKGLINQVKKTRTVVLPVINDLVERTEAALTSITPASLGQYEVKYIETPDVMKNTNLFTSLRGLADAEVNENIYAGYGLPTMSEAGLIELMRTGIGTADTEILTWVLSHGGGHLSFIWNEIFVDSRFRDNAKYEPQNAFISLMRESDDSLLYATVIYLLANRLYNNPPTGTSMSLDVFNDNMDALRIEAGAHLYRKLSSRVRAEELGLLVQGFTSNTVSVHIGAYDTFIARGGSNDMLLGMLISNDRKMSIEDVLEKGSEYKRLWEIKTASIHNQNAGLRKLHTVRALKEVFIMQMREASQSETMLRNSNDVIDRFHEMLTQVEEIELNDLHLLAIRLVCRSRFTNDDSEKILTAAHRIGMEDTSGKLDGREAVSLAVFEYIVDWCFAQLQVGRIAV